MSVAPKSNFRLWKAVLPLLTIALMFLIPAPENMPPQAWRFFSIFIAMIAGMIAEPIPATAISFIAVVICIAGGDYLLFSPAQLAEPNFDSAAEAMKWGLAGFSGSVVWLVFGAFIFALGYEATGLGRRIALLMVKYMGRSTLTLGYAIIISDVLLAPFTPSNTARTGGTVFPVIKNLPPLFDSRPNDPSARRIGSYLMWMMVVATSISSSMFITGAAPNMLALDIIGKSADIHISWMQWFLAFLPVAVLLLLVSPWLAYKLYKPDVTESGEVSSWADNALREIGRLTVKELTLIILVFASLILWVFGRELGINATLVALIAVSFMLALGIVPWQSVIAYSSAWNVLVNLACLITMAHGLTVSGFISWFAKLTAAHLAGFSPTEMIIALVLIFYFAHYLFASLTAHTATMLPVMLALGADVPGLDMRQLSLLLALSIGIMGCLTPYATSPGIIIYGSGYIASKDYWRLGFIFGIFFISLLLCVGWPILALWN